MATEEWVFELTGETALSSIVITRVGTQDARFQLKPGEGVDAIHTNPQYAYAVARLHTSTGLTGAGLALTLGENVCA